MAQENYGTLALVGSGEYLPKIEPVDAQLLQRLHEPPRVVVLPTAAATEGQHVIQRWAEMGVAHFQRLGVPVEPVMLLTRADADREEIVAQVARANFIYFSGGKPRYLLEALQGSRTWEAIKRVLANGGVVAGCSAGAMVMGQAFFDFPQIWRMRPALDVVHNLAIIPHFDEMPAFFADNAIRAAGKLIVAGIEGSTALIGSSNGWTVIGSGGVTIFANKSKTRYTQGQTVPLEPLGKE